MKKNKEVLLFLIVIVLILFVAFFSVEITGRITGIQYVPRDYQTVQKITQSRPPPSETTVTPTTIISITKQITRDTNQLRTRTRSISHPRDLRTRTSRDAVSRISEVGRNLEGRKIKETITPKDFDQPLCIEEGLAYSCGESFLPNNCITQGKNYFENEEGAYEDVTLNCCTKESFGWTCYFFGEKKEKQPTCDEQGYSYSCSDSALPNNCVLQGLNYFNEQGQDNLEINCCVKENYFIWTCYFKEEQAQETCDEQGLSYNCNAVYTRDACVQSGMWFYEEAGYTNLNLNCCKKESRGSYGYTCYFEGEQQPPQPACNQEGNSYSCLATYSSNACMQTTMEYYIQQSYSNVVPNCCIEAAYGWDCYVQGQAPPSQTQQTPQEYVTTCVCNDQGCTPT